MSKYLPLPKNYTRINGVAFYPSAPKDPAKEYFDYPKWLQSLPNGALKSLAEIHKQESKQGLMIQNEIRRRQL